MAQQIGQLITTTTLPTTSYASSQSDLCSVSQTRGMLIRQRFGSEKDFLKKVNPDTMYAFGRKAEAAITGNYPTLNDIEQTYGKGFATEWLIPLIDTLSLSTSANNPKEYQQLHLAKTISTEYRHLKVTEILLFFYRFRAGYYGRFYRDVDPMVVVCALRDFLQERAVILSNHSRTQQEEKREDVMSREEWLEIKTITAMYNSDYTV